MWNKGFEGWYFKHQLGDDIVAFIPGRAESGAFVQMITRKGSKQFDVPRLTAECGVICAGDCLFSDAGCLIDLPGVSGKIVYGRLAPLKSDIMGPFRFLPMECRHGIISMGHALSGELLINGVKHSFDGGRGYIEKDRGTSFPSSYMWLQCNDFAAPCSIMLSIARIPFGKTSFTGCICAILFGGQEYRLATYNGVKINAAEPQHICLSQGKLLLEVDINAQDKGHTLSAPIDGKMTATIRESHRATIRCRLWKHDKQIFDLTSRRASFECVQSTAEPAK